MKLALLLACLLAAACSTSPTSRSDSTKGPGMIATRDPLPVPKSGITIPGEGTAPLLDVVTDFERVTGLRFVLAPDVRAQLTKMTSGLTQPLEVPASRVYSTVENLLVESDFMLVLLQDEPPLMVTIVTTSPGARGGRMLLGRPGDLELVSRHPAFLTSIVLTLPHVSVRDMSNSMRQVMQNPAVMQLIPVGNSDSILLSGRGAEVASAARILLAAEESEARRQAEDPKRPPSSAPVKEPDTSPK